MLRRQIVFVAVGLLCNFPVVLSQGFGMVTARYLSDDLAAASESYSSYSGGGGRAAF